MSYFAHYGEDWINRDVNNSNGPDGLRSFYYLIQDPKCLIFSLIGLQFKIKPIYSKDEPAVVEEDEHQERLRPGDRVNIPTNDLTLMHEAIPFLPIPVALVCMTMNVIFPGTGTILSGIIGLCLGQPRINGKEGRRLQAMVSNS
ncbi:unnamed protein product [Cylicocyclus nassatus]|uniref:Uncharacterized protein n=1 Tax=Cylicocyclus nassatus TaxID=53992 RepID=A0AA36GFW7_CYLNA|nr:unnamed protein product [Cylicocyclus nassatus]